MRVSLKQESKVWSVTVEGPRVTYTWGKKDGKMQTKVDNYTEGKQSRDAEQQAQFEALSTAKRKIRLGYFLDVEHSRDLPSELCKGLQQKFDSIKPMLAKKYEDQKLKVTPYVFAQPKLDGIRCVANLKTGLLFTRGRKAISGLRHIESQVQALRQHIVSPDVEWIDGEIFRKGLGFQTITSLAKKQTNLTSESSVLQYHIYDLVVNKPFDVRFQMLEDAFKTFTNLPNQPSVLTLVSTTRIPRRGIPEMHTNMIAEKYEGTIIRLCNNTGYEIDKRSSSLLKLKDFIQEEYEVVGFNKEANSETLGSVQLKDVKGNYFSATPSMTDVEKLEIWNNQHKYSDSKATVKYFEHTESGIPRFPVLIGFRESDT